jgi:glycosyltransferase involved in cell wall biosynthesis
MKAALVHDYIKEYGGAERVLEALHEIYPDAPVYTSVFMPEFLGPHRERFRNWDIRTSWLQYLPFRHKLISPFRLIAPFVFGQFDLSGYDVVITSATGAYFPNLVRKITRNFELGTKKRDGVVLICYCHTPPRYLYGYATARDWKKNRVFAVLGGVANHFLRMVDFAGSKRVDFYIANSREVASRIEKFYRREARVIYPPIDIVNSKFQILLQEDYLLRRGVNSKQTQNSKLKIQKKGYYLTGGRLARAKHTDLIVRACQELGVRLKVFGREFGGNATPSMLNDKWPMLNGKGIEFLGEVSDEEKMELMRNARGFIFAGEDEDFGIVPVEAMSCGTPVIAYKSGGVLETVIEGETGVFFGELSAGSLKEAMQRFEAVKFDRHVIWKRTERFSKERFKKEIRELVSAKVST